MAEWDVELNFQSKEALDNYINTRIKNSDRNMQVEIESAYGIFSNDSSALFQDCNKIKDLNLIKVNKLNIDNLSNTFSGCELVENISFANNQFINKDINDLSQSFKNCYNLKEINLDGLYSVNNSFEAFANSYVLTDINGIDKGWFYNVEHLKNKYNLENMFYNCYNLSSNTLDNISSAVPHYNMTFAQNNELKYFGFNLENINLTTNLNSVINLGFNLKGWNIPIGKSTGPIWINFTTNEEYNLDYNVNNQEELKHSLMKFQGFNASNYTNRIMSIGSKDSIVTNLSNMFRDFNTDYQRWRLKEQKTGLASIEIYNLSDLDVSNVVNTSNMFYWFYDDAVSEWRGGGSAIHTINLAEWNTSKIKDTSNMFYSCQKLYNLDLTNTNFYNATNCFWMFKNCDSLSSNSWNMIANSIPVYNNQYFSYNEPLYLGINTNNYWVCNNLMGEAINTLTNKGWNFGGYNVYIVPESSNMYVKYYFGSEYSNVSLSFVSAKDLHWQSEFWISYLGKRTMEIVMKEASNNRFYNFHGVFHPRIKELSGDNSSPNVNFYDLNFLGFNLDYTIDFSNMFYDMWEVENIEMNIVNQRKSYNFINMFYNCGSLENLTLKDWQMSDRSSVENMFYNCYNLSSDSWYNVARALPDGRYVVNNTLEYLGINNYTIVTNLNYQVKSYLRSKNWNIDPGTE